MVRWRRAAELFSMSPMRACVAFELKEDDMHAILQSVDFPVSKPELNALFRKAGHSNYRVCGDQLLRNFLKGLAQRAN